LRIFFERKNVKLTTDVKKAEQKKSLHNGVHNQKPTPEALIKASITACVFCDYDNNDNLGFC
jgi:uncharacterized OsmC-like protein